MDHPTTRVLTVLELLRTYERISGPELARRLEGSPRSVRKYGGMLQDPGIPVEGTYGRDGGYQLRAGYMLPPLMFTDDEAVALVVGVLAVRRSGLRVAAPHVEGALAGGSDARRVPREATAAAAAHVQEHSPSRRRPAARAGTGAAPCRRAQRTSTSDALCGAWGAHTSADRQRLRRRGHSSAGRARPCACSCWRRACAAAARAVWACGLQAGQ